MLVPLGCLAAAAISCDDGVTGPGGLPAAISISPTSVTIVVDSVVELDADVQDAAGTGVSAGPVGWSSSDTAVATVDSEGRVHGVHPGLTVVTARIDALSDSAAVTVIPPIGSVSVWPDRWSMVTGGRVPLSATLLGGGGDTLETFRQVTWTTSDPAVARVDSVGLVTAHGIGEALIVATVENRADTTRITVTEIDLVSVSAGGFLDCGLTADGEAYCWGGTDYGVGAGYEMGSNAPVPVAGGHTFTDVEAGGAHACGLDADGAAYCWGENHKGELGNGGTNGSLVPVAVMGGLQLEQLSVGGGRTCGLTAAGQAYCWGAGEHGQVGDSTRENRTVPTRVYGGHTFVQISASARRHSCAVRDDKVALCWGHNHHGQLGIGDQEHRSVIPVPVATDVRFESIGAYSHGHSCGISTEGTAYCWGHNDFGQVGRGWTDTDEYDVAPVEGSVTFSQVDGQDVYTCGVSAEGAAYCWGHGYLGNGVRETIPSPTQVNHDVGFATIDAGLWHTCGMGLDGIAYCWGRMAGDGSNEVRYAPVRVAGQPESAI